MQAFDQKQNQLLNQITSTAGLIRKHALAPVQSNLNSKNFDQPAYKGSQYEHSISKMFLYPPALIQPKLTINQPNDVYEQEADGMADKVMRMSMNMQPFLPSKRTNVSNIQRKCAHCEEEEKLQTKESDHIPNIIQPKLTINQPNDVYEQEADAMADKVMRMSTNTQPFFTSKQTNVSNIQRKCAHCEEEEEKLQRKETGNTIPSLTPAVNQTLQSHGQPMDNATRNFMEVRFGHDFSKVQIHNNALAHQSAKDINAFAYTYGKNIIFGSGQYNPQSNAGKKLLAHELTHVIQQNGKVNHIQRAGPGPINCDPANIRVFNKYMHRKWCNEPRSCSFQGDTCASATRKVWAGSGCVSARTILQQKCFKKGDPDYEEHMQQIAEASEALRNCIQVMEARCAMEVGLAAAAAAVAVTLGKAAKGALGKAAGKAFIYAEAAAAIILLASGKAEAKISLSGDSALESLYKAMKENGTPIPDDLKKLIESDPDLKKMIEESAEKGGKLSDVQKDILKKYTDYVSKHLDEFSKEELEQLMSSADSISQTSPDPSVDAIKKSLKQKSDQKNAQDVPADADAKKTGDAKPSTPSKDADVNGGVNIGTKDQDKPATADLKKKYPKLSDAALKQIQDAPAPVRFLLESYLSKDPGGFEINDALISRFFSVVPATLTQEQAEKISGNVQADPNATLDEVFDNLKASIKKVTAQKDDAPASGEADGKSPKPDDPKKDEVSGGSVNVSKDDSKQPPSKSDKEMADIWEKLLAKIEGFSPGDMHISATKAPYKIGVKNQEALFGRDADGVVYAGVITFIVVEMHGNEWKVKILAGATLYTHGRKYGTTSESTSVFNYTPGQAPAKGK